MDALAAPLDVLRRQIDGDVLDDHTHRRLYSTDASVYQQLPLGIVRPRHGADCQAIVRFAAQHGIPLIPRAAGTSLAGQCVGTGLVVDVSRYMTEVIEVNAAERWVRVQPGVILDDLNDLLAPHGLMFGPETSTSNRCMIGGMIGNNAAGSHSIVHGTTRDHVLELELVLADGNVTRFGPVDEDELGERRRRDDLEGAIYREVVDLLQTHRQLIRESSPKPEILRRNTGYPLDRLLDQRPLADDGPLLNLTPLMCGSEGTLALITEAKLNLIEVPQHNLVVCAHFETLDEGTRGTVLALEHEPSAVELMDGEILDLSKHNLEAARNRFWVEGEPSAVLAIEFFDDDPDRLQRRAQGLIAAFGEAEMGYAFPIVESARVPQVWAVRKAGLGLLTGKRGDHKPVTVVEDVAVAPADLPEYVRRMQALMERHGASAVYYGHASVGELHVRPVLSLRDPDDVRRFRAIASDVADLAGEFDASLAGEHGVGRLRAEFIEQVLGADFVGLLRRVKRAFDPEGLFNPGKIVDALPMDTDLRVVPGRPVPEIDTVLDWSAEQGLLRAAERCNGAGACRKTAGRGTMCPSYMATGEELHSTRGRANLLRQLLSAEDPSKALSSDELHEALELCLSCKGCASECPSSVDVARMKAEFLQHHHDAHGTPLPSYVLGQFGKFAAMARFTPTLASAVSNTALAKKVLGVDPRRVVPSFAAQTFSAWFRGHDPHANAGERGEVVLFVDEFTEYTDPAVGVAATEFLEAAGFAVIAPAGLDSARTQISKGLLRKARAAFEKALTVLHPHAEAGLPIVGLEPSAILGFRDEAPDLVRGEEMAARAAAVADRAVLFEEFVVQQAAEGRLDLLEFVAEPPDHILLHGHCHQKSLVGVQPSVDALQLIPGARVEVIPSGCCGMAGSFGYHHYDVSMAIGELVLFPAVRAAAEDTVLAAPGTSCRHQIHDGTERTALHPAQILRAAIDA
jgi:FAD/FMN-containing dehydrogenase/Fe-S oxidoreductase